MAGDWIPYQKSLPGKPEVGQIMADTGLTRGEVVYCLMELWAWFDEHTTDGVLCHGDVTLLSRCCVTSSEQFLRAMISVGWIKLESDRISIPNFDRWMSNSGKQRLLAARRQRNKRQNQSQIDKSCHADVTQMSRNKRDKNVTTVQDRTEENGRRNPSIPSSCSETAETVSRADEPPADRLKPILTFPCDGPVDHWHLTGDHLAEWSRSFPSLDILDECRRALAWIQANPEKRKTARGMPRYLVNWLSRSQDRKRGTQPQAKQPESLDDRVKRITEGL